jgi:hypothetical protein
MHVLGLMYCVWKQTKYVRNFISLISWYSVHQCYSWFRCQTTVHGCCFIIISIYTYHSTNLAIYELNQLQNFADRKAESRQLFRWV